MKWGPQDAAATSPTEPGERPRDAHPTWRPPRVRSTTWRPPTVKSTTWRPPTVRSKYAYISFDILTGSIDIQVCPNPNSIYIFHIYF